LLLLVPIVIEVARSRPRPVPAITALLAPLAGFAASLAVIWQATGSWTAAFDAQLKTTHLYGTPKEAIAAMGAPDLISTMTKVRDFSFSKGLFGPGARSADAVGMGFPGGKTLGDAANVKLHFDPAYMVAAAAGWN
jgi:NitT/TauT family transport system substrate-binding protein